MRSRYQTILCCLLLLQLRPAASAQVPGYHVFNPEEKTTRLHSLRAGRDGYLYTGSTNGLLRFDGSRFNPLPVTGSSRPDTVTALFEDSRGEWWMGMHDGRIARGPAGRLRYFEPEEGSPRKRITCFTEDGSGRIWIGTAGEGLYYLQQNRLYLLNEEDGLSDQHIHDLAATGNGAVLAATDQGINTCRVTGNRKTVQVTGPAQGLPDYMVTVLTPAGNDLFWVGMQDQGICSFNARTGSITIPDVRKPWRAGTVHALRYDQGTLWIATQDSGLMCWQPGGNPLAAVPALPRHKTAFSICNDAFGNLWLLADNQALVRTAGNSLKLYPLYDAAYYPTVHALLADRAGNFWTGTNGAVVQHRVKPGGFTSRRYPLPGLPAQSDITSLYEDPYGRLWIGTMGSGIWCLQPATGICTRVPGISAASSILSLNGRDSTLCAAGLEGAFVMELQSGTQPPRVTVYNNLATIGSRYIYSLYQDSRKRYWFATDGRGLTLLSEGRFTHYGSAEGIRDGHIYAITEDHQGRIWFSTSDAGIYCFNGRQFINYALREGLSSLSIAALKTDAEGNIVVVHREGLDILHPGTGQFSYVRSLELNDDLGAACTDANGNVYLTTPGGILRYRSPAGARHQPLTVIESVQLFLTDTDTTARHRFSYDENNFTFFFRGLYFSNPEQVYYRYKLEGFSGNWILTADDNQSFPKLPPGHYVFRVQSSLNKQFSQATEAAYAFSISLPFWKTWWFIGGSIALLATLLILFIKRRENQLRQVSRLQAEKARFELDVLRNQVNPHFLFNSFNTLISTIEDDPPAAVRYVEQLSDFFRNIVNYRDHDLIPLREELQLLGNYLYLQQQRYGSHLQLLLEVEEEAREHCWLPPLTLQLLMENAVKHNVVSKEARLQIRIRMEGDYLVVENNLNPKLHAEKGTGMGLENIIRRYALLSGHPVEVIRSSQLFTVKLPVLKK